MERLAQNKGYRHSVDRKLRAAGRLLQAALAELGEVTVPDVSSEFDRRDLVMLCRALASLVFDLTLRLSELAALELVESCACPHCGWSRPCLADGTCPRCLTLREARRADQQAAVVQLLEGRRRFRR